MPLVPRYTWSETEDSVEIHVLGVTIKDQAQLLCGDVVVKLSAAPYLLLLDLAREVDPGASRAAVQQQGGALRLSLRKVCDGAAGAAACFRASWCLLLLQPDAQRSSRSMGGRGDGTSSAACSMHAAAGCMCCCSNAAAVRS